MFATWLRSWFLRSAAPRRSAPRRSVGLRVEGLEDRLTPTTFTVTSLADTGGLFSPVNPTLRAAINSANLAGGGNLINFFLGAGVQKISPGLALTAISDLGLTIDGTAPASLPTQSVVIDGTSAGAAVSGFTVSAGSVTIQDLTIQNFNSAGVLITKSVTGNGDVVQSNTITANTNGVEIDDSNGNTIGGTLFTAGNTITNNTHDGVLVKQTALTNNAAQNAILSNNISGNTNLGIELNGVTQIAPTPTTAVIFPATNSIRVVGQMPGFPNTSFTIQVFANATGTQGQRFLGGQTVTTDASGIFRFNVTTVSPSVSITLTATPTTGATADTTSQFSGPLTATVQTDLVGVFRASSGTWFLSAGNTNYNPAVDRTISFGAPGDMPVVGNWGVPQGGGVFTSNGSTTIGVFRPRTGTWFLSETDTNFSTSNTLQIQFGAPGDIPVVGDWFGDGVTLIGVFRPSTGTWYLSTSNMSFNTANTVIVSFGMRGDIPVVGDWTGANITEIGVFRPNTGTWFLSTNNQNYSPATTIVAQFGTLGDMLMAGDWNDTGRTKIGVFRPSVGTWFLSAGNTNYTNPPDSTAQFGANGDIPVACEWNPAARGTKIGVFRPSAGTWFLSAGNTNFMSPPDTMIQFGMAGDAPVVGNWL
jgi:hypothetical protein